MHELISVSLGTRVICKKYKSVIDSSTGKIKVQDSLIFIWVSN